MMGSTLGKVTLLGLLLLGSARAVAQTTPPEGAPPAAVDRAARRQLAGRYPRTADLLAWLSDQKVPFLAQLLELGLKTDAKEESEGLALARQHHPELAKLLDVLRMNQPRAYQAAVRELVTDTIRLKRLAGEPGAEKDALERWMVRSELRLLMARAGRRGGRAPARNGALETLIRRDDALRRKDLERQLERLDQRAQRLRQQLAESPEESVARQLRQLQRRAGSRAAEEINEPKKQER